VSGKTNILTSGQVTISNILTVDASTLPGGFKVSGNHSKPDLRGQRGRASDPEIAFSYERLRRFRWFGRLDHGEQRRDA